MADPIIRLDSVCKSFRQPGPENGRPPVEVLRDVTLAVAPGEFVAMQGTSGSGKSTLLHIIGLLDRPSSGRYLLKGDDVAALCDDALSDLRNRAIGFVFQSFYLIPYATALDNVLLPGMYSGRPQAELKERGEELLTRVGLSDRMDFKPNELSGGQQQRVAMARALLNDPDIILADEPTGQLDSATSREIIALFHTVNELGKTIVLVTHDEAIAASAGRIVRLHDGLIQP